MIIDIHECPRCGYQGHPDFEPSTPESRQAWADFYSTSAVANAQSEYSKRQAELAGLREHYNTELTRARLAFQAATHDAMLKLTMRLRELDMESAAHLDELG